MGGAALQVHMAPQGQARPGMDPLEHILQLDLTLQIWPTKPTLVSIVTVVSGTIQGSVLCPLNLIVEQTGEVVHQVHMALPDRARLVMGPLELV